MKKTGKDAVAGQGTTQNNGMAEDWKNEEVDCGGENQSGLGEKQLKERTGPDVSEHGSSEMDLTELLGEGASAHIIHSFNIVVLGHWLEAMSRRKL